MGIIKSNCLFSSEIKFYIHEGILGQNFVICVDNSILAAQYPHEHMPSPKKAKLIILLF